MGFCSQEVSPVSLPAMTCFSHFSAKRQHCFAKRSLRPLEPVIFNELVRNFWISKRSPSKFKRNCAKFNEKSYTPLNFKVNWLGFENPYLLRLVKDEIVTKQLRFISVSWHPRFLYGLAFSLAQCREFLSHLSKVTSGCKQKYTPFLTLFSGTAFQALSLDALRFARSAN